MAGDRAVALPPYPPDRYKIEVPRSAIPPLETITPAIVIRARAFGDSDKIVTFLTRDLGKVAGIAKGAKNSKRRFVNVLEPFTHVRLRLRQRSSSDLGFIDACELLDAPLSFARDLTKFGYASYILELTDRMVREREAGGELYELVRDALAYLERATPTTGILRTFELGLLRLTGYEPALDRCRRCSAALAGLTSMYVHPGRGGVLCARCRGEGRAYVASRPTLERLMELQRARFDGADVSSFDLTPGMAAEARALVRSFFAANLTAPLASERFLEDVQIDPPEGG
jgi:DNA repair protein RecO (recombination protein O)